MSNGFENYFQRDYYKNHYSAPFWRKRGDRPFLFNSLLRLIRRSGGAGTLLDVGCGEGHFIRRALAASFQATGIDISQEGVDSARRNTTSEAIILGSATNIPFEDECFDVVCCFDVVEHLEHPDAFFLEAKRVLKKGGLLLFSTPNTDSIGHRLKGNRSYMYLDPTHVSLHPRGHWRLMVEAEEFTILKDGTDTCWDPPYLLGVPQIFQRVFFLLLAHTMWAFQSFYSWSLGENYYCLAQKRP